MEELHKFLCADMIAKEVERIGDKEVLFKVAITEIADSEEITASEKWAFIENLKETIEKYDLVEEDLSLAVKAESKDGYLHISVLIF